MISSCGKRMSCPFCLTLGSISTRNLIPKSEYKSWKHSLSNSSTCWPWMPLYLLGVMHCIAWTLTVQAAGSLPRELCWHGEEKYLRASYPHAWLLRCLLEHAYQLSTIHPLPFVIVWPPIVKPAGWFVWDVKNLHVSLDMCPFFCEYVNCLASFPRAVA